MLERLETLPAGRTAKWAIIAAWIAAALGLGWLQPRLQRATETDPAAFLPQGAESTRVRELLRARFGGDEATALVVYRSADGLGPDARAAIRADVAALRRQLGDAVGEIAPLPPQASETVSAVAVPIEGDSVEAVQPTVTRIRSIVGGGPPGVRAYVTGPAAILVDAAEIFDAIDVTLLLATTALILVLLVAIYRSPLVALVPLAVVGTAYAVAAGVVYLLVSGAGLEINPQATGILIVLMFGAGTDYSLLLVARYREELRRAEDTHAAMRRALRGTTPAILSSGSTVAAAMLVLLVADLSSTRTSGPVLAIGVAFIMLAGLSLLPAVLLALGRRAFWPAAPGVGEERGRGRRLWERVGDLVRRRPVAVLAVTVTLLSAGILGNAVDLRGIGFAEGFREQPESIEGLRALAQGLPAGAVAPTDVLVRAAPGRLDEAAAQVRLALAELEPVASVRRTGTGGEGRLARLEVVLGLDPYGDRAIAFVDDLRRAAARAAPPGADVLVGGPTAEEADTQRTVAADFRLIAPLALGLILLILVALLRSLVAPLFLVASQVLTFYAALGISYAAFEWLFDAPGSDAALPTFVFIFTVALGIDYTIFLMARVREEAIEVGHERGVVDGLVRTGGVITSAGVILAGTFAVLTVLPLEQLFQIGVAVAVGVLLDTFVVRTLVVPAAALVVGERTWWPGGPRRLLRLRSSRA